MESSSIPPCEQAVILVFYVYMSVNEIPNTERFITETTNGVQFNWLFGIVARIRNYACLGRAGMSQFAAFCRDLPLWENCLSS